MGFDVGWPLFVRRACGLNDIGIKMKPRVRYQAFFKVVADLSFAFHPKIRLGPAGVATKVRLGRALDDHDAGAFVCSGHGGR